jgi:hypothetical protein
VGRRIVGFIVFAMLVADASSCSPYSDAASSDAGAIGDATATDATNGDGGGSAEGGPSDAGALPFCKTNAGTLCEDFDDPGSAALPRVEVGDGGAFVTVTDRPASPPNAARVTFVVVADQTCRYAGRFADLDAASGDGFRVEYKIRLNEPVGGRIFVGPEVTMVTSDDRNQMYYLELTAMGAILRVETDLLPTQEIPLSRRPIPGQWSEIVVDLHGGSGARKVSVTIDGAAAATDVALAAEHQSAYKIRKLFAGALCVTGFAQGKVSFDLDDIRLTARP